jgi:hypothetical protein
MECKFCKAKCQKAGKQKAGLKSSIVRVVKSISKQLTVMRSASPIQSALSLNCFAKASVSEEDSLSLPLRQR